MNFLEKIYNWTLAKAKSRNAICWLSVISFCEGFFSPIFPDPLLALIVSLNRAKAFLYTIICTIASISGGAIGYYLGSVLYDIIGKSILEFYGHEDMLNTIDPRIHKYAFIIIMLKTFTPIPYKIIAIICGVLRIDFSIFMLASFCSRLTRFFIVAFLGKAFGDKILELLTKNKRLCAVILLLSIVIGILLVFKI